MISNIHKNRLRVIEKREERLISINYEILKKKDIVKKLDEYIALESSSVTDMNERLLKDSRDYESDKKKKKEILDSKTDKLKVVQDKKNLEQSVLQRVSNEIKELENEKRILVKGNVSLKSGNEVFTGEAILLSKEINKLKTNQYILIGKNTNDLLKIQNKIEKAQIKLNKAEIKLRKVNRTIQNENVIFSKREKDISILERRLKKRYPDERLILVNN